MKATAENLKHQLSNVTESAKAKDLQPVRNPLPNFFSSFGEGKDIYSLTTFLPQMSRDDAEDERKEQKVIAQKGERDSIDFDSPEYLQQMYAEQ